MKVIGFRKNDFTGKDGKEIYGMRLYLTAPLSGNGKDADGQSCESIYMTDEKLARCGYTPKVGDEVNVSYNRYQKPDNITLIKA